MKNKADDAKQPKLLSIVVTGRNDDYTSNFKYRITTSTNYIVRNLKNLRRLDDAVSNLGEKM